MTQDRVQRALDGELPFEQLEPAEAELYHQYRQAFAAALRPLGQVPRVDVAPAVLRAIAPAPRVRKPRAGLVARLWAPRTFTVRPAFGLAAAALAVFAWVTQSATPAPGGPAVPAVQRLVVDFRLSAPDAATVALVGDFNAWQPGHQLREVAPGIWAVSVRLEPGVYDYGFIVDGTSLRLDPLAPSVSDGFGGESSRLAVLAPETSL